MKQTLRDQEGYLQMDNRLGGVPDEMLRAAGLPVGAGRGNFEAPTFTCSHCQSVKVKDPRRNQEFQFCRGCNHLICDHCAGVKAATGQCRTFDQIVDEHLNAAARQSSGG